MLRVLALQTRTGKIWCMDFQVKVGENRRNNIFREYQTTNMVLFTFLHITGLTER